MIPPYTEFEKAAYSAVGKKVKITFNDGRMPFVGYCTSFSRALDNEPEIADIGVKYRKSDDWGTGFDETEIDTIVVIE